jgi:hypothetical protein
MFRLNERHHHSGFVSSRQVNRAAASGHFRGGLSRPVHADPGCPGRQPVFAQQVDRQHLHVIDVGHMAEHLGEAIFSPACR